MSSKSSRACNKVSSSYASSAERSFHKELSGETGLGARVAAHTEDSVEVDLGAYHARYGAIAMGIGGGVVSGGSCDDVAEACEAREGVVGLGAHDVSVMWDGGGVVGASCDEVDGTRGDVAGTGALGKSDDVDA